MLPVRTMKATSALLLDAQNLGPPEDLESIDSLAVRNAEDTYRIGLPPVTAIRAPET